MRRFGIGHGVDWWLAISERDGRRPPCSIRGGILPGGFRCFALHGAALFLYSKAMDHPSVAGSQNLRNLCAASLAAGVLAVAPLCAEAASPEKLPLWSGPAPMGDGTFQPAVAASITVHQAPQPNGAAMVICPGGGYGNLVMGPEGHGIARWLNLHGVTGIVLEYRLPKGMPSVPLLDAQRAIRTVRSHAKEWNIDPNRIGIIGFSAGGHLASTAGTHFDAGDKQASDPIEQVSCRPDFMVLIYPVITTGPKTHGGSKGNLLGHAKPEIVELFSNEKQVTEQTPPAFLAHAQDDAAVPADNSQMFYDALQAHKVEAKYLKLPYGNHGLNGYKGPMWDAWQTESLEWMAALKFIPATDAVSAPISTPSPTPAKVQ